MSSFSPMKVTAQKYKFLESQGLKEKQLGEPDVWEAEIEDCLSPGVAIHHRQLTRSCLLTKEEKQNKQDNIKTDGKYNKEGELIEEKDPENSEYEDKA